jgi:hypothetical protein
VQQKRYRYTGKERDDSSGLCYYGARYLAPWLARWISPDSTGVDSMLFRGRSLGFYIIDSPNSTFFHSLLFRCFFTMSCWVETPEQEAVEEGAVGGVNNIKSQRPASKEHRIDKDALHNSSKKMAQVQQNIFQLDVFKKLGALESSSRNPTLEEYKRQTIDMKIKQLRDSTEDHIANITQTGVPYPNDFIQFFASKKYEDLVIDTYLLMP